MSGIFVCWKAAWYVASLVLVSALALASVIVIEWVPGNCECRCSLLGVLTWMGSTSLGIQQEGMIWSL